MTQENKELLLKDLCARLPYGVICEIYNEKCTITEKLLFDGISRFADDTICVRPYLRPISSMTEEEEEEYNSLNAYEGGFFPHTEEAFDYLNKNHFDYRGLIPKGLAIEAPDGMYNLNIY